MAAQAAAFHVVVGEAAKASGGAGAAFKVDAGGPTEQLLDAASCARGGRPSS